MFYIYPADVNTFAVDEQFFFGQSVLISPVTDENATSVDIYLPDDIFYDWNDGFAPVQGSGSKRNINNVDFQTIPIHVRGGSILPLRAQSANTTTALRKQPFEIVIAPAANGTASGKLYLDDGLSLEPSSITYITFNFDGKTLSTNGAFGYNANDSISQVTLLGQSSVPSSVTYNSNSLAVAYNSTTKVARIAVRIPLSGPATVSFGQIASFTGHAAKESANTFAATLGIAVSFLLIVVSW